MKDLDTSGWVLQKQVEIRRPSARGYFFDIVWVDKDLKKGAVLSDGVHKWVIAETYGTRKMPRNPLQMTWEDGQVTLSYPDR